MGNPQHAQYEPNFPSGGAKSETPTDIDRTTGRPPLQNPGFVAFRVAGVPCTHLLYLLLNRDLCNCAY